MLDEDQSAGHEVWGVWVPRRPSGRFKWPDELKVKIIERIEGGEKIGVIARQVGAKDRDGCRRAVDKRIGPVRTGLRKGKDRTGIDVWVPKTFGLPRDRPPSGHAFHCSRAAAATSGIAQRATGKTNVPGQSVRTLHGVPIQDQTAADAC